MDLDQRKLVAAVERVNLDELTDMLEEENRERLLETIKTHSLDFVMEVGRLRTYSSSRTSST